ncbi:MAG: recombination mediator RecR [Chloroflexota bacterium]
MTVTVEPIARLIEEFARLPGIGPKTAQRLTFFLLRQPKETVLRLSDAIVHMKERTMLCSVCLNLTDVDPCPVCRDDRRDASMICVVEEPLDILAVERSREFRGKYHVLHGAISPMEGIGPDDLKISELLRRLGDGVVQEVILATNPNVEGEATATYLARLLRPLGLRVSRIARGLPAGGDLEYADDVTLASALEGRRLM